MAFNAHVLPALLLAGVPTPALTSLPSDEAFDKHWYDGHAEVCGYRWRGERYGEERRGEAVAVFVTEPFSATEHVKLDRPGRDPDRVTALKLNLVRDFQTGIYDYNTMVSCFVRADDFALMKLTFSSAEWCGHVYEEIDVRDAVKVDTRSYFQGESGERTLEARADGLVGDQLLVWLRGLRGHVLAPGEDRTLPFLPGSFERRLRHEPPRWSTVRVRRAKVSRVADVPAGRFAAVVYTLEAGDGRTATVHVEEAYPHRLLEWEWSRDGAVLDAGRMTGSKRMKYWELHDEGQESLRSAIGLK